MAIRERFALFLQKTAQAVSGKTPFSYGLPLNGAINAVSLGALRISTDSLFTVWRNHGDVFACVRELKENTGSAGYVWQNVNDKSLEPNNIEVSIAEKILNFNKTFRNLRAELIQSVSITGNAYILIQKSASTGQVIGVEIVDPRTLYVVTDKYGTVIRWIQRVRGEVQEFLPEEIAQWKVTADPNSPVFGLSPLEPILMEVRADMAASVSNYAFFQNDATPAAQYVLDDGITDDEAKRAVEMIHNQLKGAENRHKSIVLRGVKEIKTIGISYKDMEFTVLRKFTTEKICAAFGVPKAILNYTDDVNYSNGQEQTKKFWEGTVQPLQDSFAEFINKVLLPAFGIKTLKLVFNERKFDAKEWTESSTRADQQQGVMTINEVRKSRGLQPFDPIEVGDWVDKPLLFSGNTVVPVEDVGMNLGNAPFVPNADQAEKEIERIKTAAKLFNYGQANTKGN